MGTATRESFPVDAIEDFAPQLRALQGRMARKPGKEGPLHFPIKMNVFPCPTDATVLPLQAPVTPDLDVVIPYARKAAEMLRKAERPVVLVGHGAYRGNREALVAFLERLNLSTMTTGRGVAVVPADSFVFVGQHSILPSPRSTFLLEQRPDLLLAIGTSLGEFSSNSWSSLLTDIPSLVHINTDARCFGRLQQQLDHRVDAPVDVTLFLECLERELSPEDCAAIASRSQRLLQKVQNSNVPLFVRSELLVEDGSSSSLSGQSAVFRLGRSLRKVMGNRVCNIVADTGSSKLYAAHYIRYAKDWRCLMNSGTIDCLGYGLPASIGAALASRDCGEDAVTVCITGDGGLLMNMELNALNANEGYS